LISVNSVTCYWVTTVSVSL